MENPGNLQYDNDLFDLEEANIYGIYEDEGYMTWHIEMFPSGDNNYIMINSLVLDKIFSPHQLSKVSFKETSETSDLYEHTILVNSDDRFLKSIEMIFGNWDTEYQSIKLTGSGIIESYENLPEINYKFKAILKFKGLNIFETNKEATKQFVDTYLQDNKSKLDIKFENVASGLKATIEGSF